MKPEDLRAYAKRPWHEVAEQRREFRATRFLKHGHEATLRIARMLREHFHQIRGDDPGYEPRRMEDLAHHIELQEKLRRVADAFSRG